jgi:hypothetical protein
MRNKSLLVFAVVTIACSGLAVWAGCGSDSETTPTDDGGPGEGGASSSSGTASGSSSGSSGSNPDGGIDPPDAGPGGDTTKIACGATTCPIPSETCCISPVAGPGDRAYSCAVTAADAGCPQPDGGRFGGGGGDVISLKCTDSANCAAGTVCCVRQSRNGAASECQPSCNMNNEAQLCDKSAPDGGSGCPQQEPCSSRNIGDWGLPNGFATCGGRGGP